MAKEPMTIIVGCSASFVEGDSLDPLSVAGLTLYHDECGKGLARVEDLGHSEHRYLVQCQTCREFRRPRGNVRAALRRVLIRAEEDVLTDEDRGDLVFRP